MNARSIRWLAACCVLMIGFWQSVSADPPTESSKSVVKSRTKVATAIPPKLIGALKGKAEDLRLEALRSLTPDLAQHVAVSVALRDSVERDLRTKKITPATRLAVKALSYSGRPDDVEFVRERLQDADALLALAAADALADLRDSTAMPGIASLAERKEFAASYGYRRAVVDVAARIPDKSAIEFLISIAERFKGQLRFETVQHLARLTGQEFGGFADQWAGWWKKNGDQFQFAKADQQAAQLRAPQRSLGAPPPKIPWPEPVPEFFNVPIYGYRVVFVIDRSRSMSSAVEGVTRLKQAQDQFDKAIEVLSTEAFFNVLGFNSNVTPFARGLMPADDDNKRSAKRFSRNMFPESKTASFDGLYAGLMTDANLEALYFLTDGEPTTGRIVEMPAIVETITSHNAWQRTSIYTLGIDARGPYEEFLRQLADRNWGQFISLR